MSATVSKVEVPDIGDFDEVPVIEILVAVGDTVAPEDPLVTLESDKATMDVPAPFGGVVRELSVEIGDRVKQGTVLMSIEPAQNGSAPAEVASPAPEAKVDVAPAEAAEPEAESPLPVPTTPAEAPAPPEGGNGDAPNGPIYASPSVRRLARELGVELSGVSGTGRKGRITKADVQNRADGGSGTGAGRPGAERPWASASRSPPIPQHKSATRSNEA